jgi:hypothetical protein
VASFTDQKPYVRNGGWPHHSRFCYLPRDHKGYCKDVKNRTHISPEQATDMKGGERRYE